MSQFYQFKTNPFSPAKLQFDNPQRQRNQQLKILENYKIAIQTFSMIGLQTEVSCPSCNQDYKDTNLPRILTMCGDTFCQTCIDKMIVSNYDQNDENRHPFSIQCPKDGAIKYMNSNDAKAFPKNVALMKVIEAKKVNSSFRDESFNLSKIVKKQEIQQDEQATDLIEAINECTDLQNSMDLHAQIEKSSKKQQAPCQNQNNPAIVNQKQPQCYKQEDQMCLLHQKPLEIVCIIDNKKICSKCALFGEHKGHDFKSIQEVENQKQQCYHAILQIFKHKQQIQQRMCNQDTQSGLIQILDKKKNIMENQVRQSFRKLREEITKQQKSVLKKLQDTYKHTEQKIKSLLQVEEPSLQLFSNWEIQSYKILKVLEDPQLQPKITILYSKQQQNTKIISKGNQILAKIQQQESNLVNKVQEILTHLSCQKNQKIFEFVPDYIDILDKPPRSVETKNSNAVQKNMAISKLLVDEPSKQKIEGSNCTIFDTFNQKLNPLDGSPLLEESLLDQDKDQTICSDKSRITIANFTNEPQGRIPLKPNSNFINKNIESQSISCSFIHLELQSAKKIPMKTASKVFKDEDQDFMESSRVSSILTSRPSMILKKQNGERPNKKKLKTIKISEKYQKMLQGIYNNTVDTIDLTNAEVGDQTMMQICEFVKYSKARTIKFIRNKLTDGGVQKMLPALGNAQILNLSQNNLTEAVIDIFIKHRFGYLSGLKNLILSQNKIIERKHKAKIDQLRAMNIVVSV